ncbi:MAG: hypothetical protein AAGA71_16950, partial [Pseudomonadota bacterium]
TLNCSTPKGFETGNNSVKFRGLFPVIQRPELDINRAELGLNAYFMREHARTPIDCAIYRSLAVN